MNELHSLLLASNSPRRRQLLALGGWEYGLDVSHVDESLRPGEPPASYVRRLSEEKARAILARAHPGQVIVGADTSVVIDGQILGKPADKAEARHMLRSLRGRTHQVYTGIAVLEAGDGAIQTEVVVTDVPMRNYSDLEIEAYIETGDPMDKAGAYGIQNPSFQPVANMAGCYASVMGMPLCSLSVLLRKAGMPARSDVAANCQITIHYECPVFNDYLRGGR